MEELREMLLACLVFVIPIVVLGTRAGTVMR